MPATVAERGLMTTQAFDARAPGAKLRVAPGAVRVPPKAARTRVAPAGRVVAVSRVRSTEMAAVVAKPGGPRPAWTTSGPSVRTWEATASRLT